MALFDAIPKRALAVFAHPDDPEVACAGTLARWTAGGAKVHLVIVSAGDKGTVPPSAKPDDLAVLRAKEAAAAANVMRLSGPELLGIPDGELENTDALREQLVSILRRVQPDVVVSPDPTAVFFGDNYVNHHDHRSLGWAMLDSCAPMASAPLYFPKAGPAHQVRSLLLAGTLQPDTWVDIEDQLDTKVKAIRCHRSQLADGDGDMVSSFVKARAEQAAGSAGMTPVRYAEGFRLIALA